MNDKIDMLRDGLNELMDRISETHPKYPKYGYEYKDGKIVEVKLQKECVDIEKLSN